jgi:hypothetical protein
MTISLTEALFSENYSSSTEEVLTLIDEIIEGQNHRGAPGLLRMMKGMADEELRSIGARLNGDIMHTRNDPYSDERDVEEAAQKHALFTNMMHHRNRDTQPDWWRNMSEGDADLLAGDEESSKDTSKLEMQLESDLCELAAEQKAGIIKATLKIAKGLLQAPKGKKVDYLLDAGWPYVSALVDAKGAEWLDGIIAKFITPRDKEAGEAASAAAHASEDGGTPEDFKAAFDKKRTNPEDFRAAFDQGSDEETPPEKTKELNDGQLTDGQLTEASMRWLDIAGISYVRPEPKPKSRSKKSKGVLTEAKLRRVIQTEIMDIMPMGPPSGGSHSAMHDAAAQTADPVAVADMEVVGRLAKYYQKRLPSQGWETSFDMAFASLASQDRLSGEYEDSRELREKAVGMR